nr:aldo/keto reductase [uncultured Lactobacillus sp.]
MSGTKNGSRNNIWKKGVQPEAWAPFAEGSNQIFTNLVLQEIAQKYRKTTAQIMLRWFLQRNYVVIPKSAHKNRLAENFDAFDFELADEDMSLIKTLDQGHSILEDEMDPEIAENFR